MNLVSNQQKAIQPINSAQLVGVFKAIAPRSFEKTFEGIPTEQITSAMKICIDGLTRDQINIGLAMVRDNGFCPDPAMFRKWCLGITGFGTEQQRAQDSFKGKNAALANIVRWIGNDKSPITNAEKEAYDRCYEMFNAINYANNVDRAQYTAYEAFKENYTDVVREFVEQGVVQCEWVKPVAITKKAQGEWVDFGVDKELTPEQKAEQKEKTQEYIQKIKEVLGKGGAA